MHISIQEWASGRHQPIMFSANSAKDIYDSHMQLLKAIFETDINAYHRMMANMLLHASWVINFFFYLLSFRPLCRNSIISCKPIDLKDIIGDVDIASMEH